MKIVESTPTSDFRTIKAAGAAGFHRPKRDEYGGEQITVKGVLLAKQPLTAISETAWRKKGRKVIPGAVPHAILTARVGDGRKSVTYAVYRLDQTVEIRQRSENPEVAFPLTDRNLLAAIFAVNRSAKRYRDAAQSCYQAGSHGFAKTNKERKEMLYGLKDQGLVAAYRAGFIAAVGRHGSLTVYRGDGYCFHSPLRPKGIDLPVTSDEVIFVEAKPRDASEMRLRDAVATLEQTASDIDGFVRHTVPTHAKSRRPRRHWHDDDSEFGDDNWEFDDD